MRASGYDRAAADWYVEPSWCVDALLDAEPFDGPVWDPACGCGTIPKAVIARGGQATGTDLIDRGYGEGGRDFLTNVAPAQHIVSNPPYGIIEPFIATALACASGKVAILARLAFLAGQARREGLFRVTPPARVWVCSRRPSMPPGGTDVPAKGGSVDFAWFVFRPGYRGRTEIGWLS